MQITIDRILKKDSVYITITAKNACGFEDMNLEKTLSNKEVLVQVSRKYNLDDFVIKERCLDNISRPILKDIVITKDNIAQYYEFMSDEDKKAHKSVLHSLHGERWDAIWAFMEQDSLIFDSGEGLDYSILDNNYNPIIFNIDTVSYYLGASYFGVKDTLKPIDEYIAEIKGSSEYIKEIKLSVEYQTWLSNL